MSMKNFREDRNQSE
jgi:hypothetical protein